MYAGAYAFGKTQVRTAMVEGRARKTAGHKKPRSKWTILLRDHHPGCLCGIFKRSGKVPPLDFSTRGFFHGSSTHKFCYRAVNRKLCAKPGCQVRDQIDIALVTAGVSLQVMAKSRDGVFGS